MISKTIISEQGVGRMDTRSVTASMLEFIKNNVLSITELTRSNKLSEILESYANKKSNEIYIVKNNRIRDAQGALIDIELLAELLALRESVFEAADHVIEEIALDRIDSFRPETSLSQALHQMDVEDIEVEEILRLSDELEI